MQPDYKQKSFNFYAGYRGEKTELEGGKKGSYYSYPTDLFFQNLPHLHENRLARLIF